MGIIGTVVKLGLAAVAAISAALAVMEYPWAVGFIALFSIFIILIIKVNGGD